MAMTKPSTEESSRNRLKGGPRLGRVKVNYISPMLTHTHTPGPQVSLGRIVVSQMYSETRPPNFPHSTLTRHFHYPAVVLQGYLAHQKTPPP